MANVGDSVSVIEVKPLKEFDSKITAIDPLSSNQDWGFQHFTIKQWSLQNIKTVLPIMFKVIL